jgi:hypothetical protein
MLQRSTRQDSVSGKDLTMEAGVFTNLAGAQTVARLFSALGQKIYGRFNPQLPYPPLYSADGLNRYGFRQFYNGYVRGPEGTSLSQLQAATDRGLLPGIHQNSAGVYPRLSLQDYYDSLYLQAPNGSSFYDMYVPAEDVVTPTETGPVTKPVEPPVVQPSAPPVVPPTTPPVGQPDVSVALEAMTLKYTTLLKDHQALIRNVERIPRSYDELPTRGGGKWVNVIRSIYDDLNRLTTDAKNKPR